MRRVVQDRNGNTVGTIGDECVTGQVSAHVVDDRMGRADDRPDEDRFGTITVMVPLNQARQLAGRQVALFTLEKE